MKLYIAQIPQSEPIVLAGDHTSWSRPFAKTLQERTYEHSPSQLGGRPVTVGYGYSTLAWIPEAQGSWAVPLLHERITSWDSPISLFCPAIIECECSLAIKSAIVVGQ